jgi:hypothetical protein
MGERDAGRDDRRAVAEPAGASGDRAAAGLVADQAERVSHIPA